jgi:flagellar FliL protein
VILAVLLVAAGAAAYFFLFAGGEAEAAEPVAGEVVALEPVTVNLAGGGYLKVGISLQTTEDAAAGGHGGGGVDGSKALDILISTYSQAQPADVTGAREALKEALEQEIVEAYTEHEVEMVMGIYFTEYVTQ